MLIGIKEVSKILGVERSTAYGYIKRGWLSPHFIKLRDPKYRGLTYLWLRNQVESSVAVIAAHKAKKHDYSLNKKVEHKKHTQLKNYDLASSLMGCRA